MPCHRKTLPGVVLLLLSSLLLSGCSELSITGLFPGAGSSSPEEVYVEVKFSVQVPQNTPEGELIYLSTLDEVTGLGVNAQAHEMVPAIGEGSPDSGLVYTTTLTVPRGKILKYRYTRQNQYAVIEHTYSDDQVRYRLARANNPLELRDVVTKWSDTDYFWPEPGRISGLISDTITGEPVPGLLVTAGGVQTFTTASGSYLLPGLPPGVHNLMVYAPDGSFQEIQQGAEVASQANTEANLTVTSREMVDITFVASAPIGTPEEGLRIAGNLYQLGNTFGNLPGGMNAIPSRMPALTSAGENRYGVILSLPVGAEILYKYTLGDGFWNAEHDQEGAFKIRRLIIPDQPAVISDEIFSWDSGPKQSITFDLYTPDHTPAGEEIFIQFNPYGWTTPLPMTEIDPNHWVFILYSPFDLISDLTYRYCRAGQCGIADDSATAGLNPAGRAASPTAETQYLADTITEWAWLMADPPQENPPLPAISPRGEDFITGIELLPGASAGDAGQIAGALSGGLTLPGNTLSLTPTWSVSHQDPPVIEPNPNQDPLWYDLQLLFTAAASQDQQIALNPQAHFPGEAADWWRSAPRDFSWWNSWFDQYRNFAVHFAAAAEANNLDLLVLGGEWLEPALPGGKLADGTPSGVPADADMRWLEIITQVRETYSGPIAWTTGLPEGINPPAFLEQVDQVHLNWNPDLPLTDPPALENWVTAASLSLDGEVMEFYSAWIKPSQKSLVLRVAYPSAAGWHASCEGDATGTCYSLDAFSHPASEDLVLDRSLEHQSLAYQALLSAGTDRSWISGFISRGYYAPAVMHDRSISIHGKPAELLLQEWYQALK